MYDSEMIGILTDCFFKGILKSKVYNDMYEEYVAISSSKHIQDPEFSNVFVYHWHSIMDVDEDDWFTDEQKKISILQVANQYRQKDMFVNFQFNGAGINHDGGGFSTDISETCHWLTPFVLEPEDGMDVWYVSEGF